MATDNQQPSRKFRSCKQCGRRKRIGEFKVYEAATGARRHACNDCRKAYQAAWARGEITPEDGVNRTCIRCGEFKPLSAFSATYGKRTCVGCGRKRAAEKMRMARRLRPKVYRAIESRRYWGDREQRNAARRDWQQRLRDEVFAAYGGYRCRCCNETEKSMLTLDHVNNDGAKQRREEPAMRWAKHFYAWIVKQGFPKGLQVLCYNCNISKFRCGGICAHQLAEGSTTIPNGSRGKRLEMPSTPRG